MTQILIIKMWKYKLPALTALATMAGIFLWPALPLRGLDNWVTVYLNTPYLAFLYPVVAVFSGIYIGLYVYNKKVAPCCSVEDIKTGALGSFTGIFLGACPACIPVLAIFLPLALNIFLSRVAQVFSVLSVVILLFAIFKMNGFQKS